MISYGLVGDEPFCPLCRSSHVARKADGDRIGRWNCRVCKGSFNVLSKTIFHKDSDPTSKNAKKSLSSYQLAHDLDLTQPTALYMQARIRASMAAEERELLQGIVEADETYIDGKLRKRNKRDDDTPNTRGRGTKKTPVIGAVERGRRVVVQVADGKGDLTGPGILRFIKEHVDTDSSLLITDEYAEQYEDGTIHTNTIESFWSLVK